MLYSHHQRLEDALVQALLEGPMSIKALHARVRSNHTVSLRAVYKAAHALVDAGVLIKVGGRVLIDQEWIREVKENLASTLPMLAEGERAAYSFASIQHLDAFWKTIVSQVENLDNNMDTFIYNPHNFWAYVPERKKSEDAYYAHFARNKKQAFLVVGGTTKADMEFKRAYQHMYLQVDARPVPSINRYDHITLLGDLILTARVSASLAERIDTLYDSNRPIHKLLTEVEKAYQVPQRIRLLLEHNTAKAKRLRRLLSKNFVTPK